MVKKVKKMSPLVFVKNKPTGNIEIIAITKTEVMIRWDNSTYTEWRPLNNTNYKDIKTKYKDKDLLI